MAAIINYSQLGHSWLYSTDYHRIPSIVATSHPYERHRKLTKERRSLLQCFDYVRRHAPQTSILIAYCFHMVITFAAQDMANAGALSTDTVARLQSKLPCCPRSKLAGHSALRLATARMERGAAAWAARLNRCLAVGMGCATILYARRCS